MKIYKNLSEAQKALKEATGSARVRYFVNGIEVSPSEYRAAEGEPTIYRSGLFMHAEK